MDGVNRGALTILGASLQHPHIIVDNKEIITLFDPPHLLKCFRNLFIKYDIDCPMNISSNDVTGRGEIKFYFSSEHINLTLRILARESVLLLLLFLRL